MERQTDGQIEFSSLDRVLILCSAVKTGGPKLPLMKMCILYFTLAVHWLLLKYCSTLKPKLVQQ